MQDFYVSYFVTCPFCGEINSLELKLSEITAYENGELVQKAFPTLSATEREMIISGICPDCQDRVFGE